MNDEQLRSIMELSRAAEGLAATMRRVEARAAEPVEGSDSSGLVTVRLDGRGSVDRVDIDPGWAGGLSRELLGGAVVEAARAAGAARVADLASAVEAEEVTAAVGPGRPASGADVPDPPDFSYILPTRDIVDLAEELLNDMGAIRAGDMPTSVPTSFTGSAAGGRVRVTMSGGVLTGCEIESAWAHARSGAEISGQVVAALDDAAARQRASTQQWDDLNARMDGLLQDSMAHLAQIGRQQAEPTRGE